MAGFVLEIKMSSVQYMLCATASNGKRRANERIYEQTRC